MTEPAPMQILQFEIRWGTHTGHKEVAITSELGLAPARYYQLLHRLIDAPDIIREAPVEVHRLQRVRDERRERIRCRII